MPRKPRTDDEKLLEQQIRDLIKNSKGSEQQPAVDLPRAIRLFESAQNNITKALAILRGEEVVDEPAPGKNRVGRPRKEADLLDSIPASEVAEVKPEPATRKKKGAATAV